MQVRSATPNGPTTVARRSSKSSPVPASAQAITTISSSSAMMTHTSDAAKPPPHRCPPSTSSTPQAPAAHHRILNCQPQQESSRLVGRPWPSRLPHPHQSDLEPASSVVASHAAEEAKSPTVPLHSQHTPASHSPWLYSPRFALHISATSRISAARDPAKKKSATCHARPSSLRRQGGQRTATACIGKPSTSTARPGPTTRSRR